MTKEKGIVLKLDYNGFVKKTYRSNHITQMYVNNTRLANFTHEQEFSKKLTGRGTEYHITLNVLESNFEDGYGLKDKFGGLLEKVTSLKDQLEIALYTNGQIKSVLNKEYLKAQWENLKLQLMEDEEVQQLPLHTQEQMFNKGDEEYALDYPLENDLKKSFFYSSFFRGIYTEPFELGKHKTFKNVTFISTLFENFEIPLQVSAKLLDDKDAGEYILKLEGNVDRDKFNYALAEKLYVEKYPFLREELEKYSCEFSAMYVVSHEDMWINYMESRVEENINDKLTAYNDLEIEKVELK